MVFGFGVGFTSTAAGLVSLVSTGIGAVMIVLGYFVLRPLLRRAKTEIKGVSRKAAIATPETSSE
ncbi:hypothetical protein BMD20_29465 [Burkholderia multivorans]|nr:hypothetical protein BMD20_29465 [Burkholderia multivorans]KHS10398.1 hypothetical protein BMD22_28365 [Burkholderia multivorans]